MGELLKEFLRQTISSLHILQKESCGNERFSDDFLRRFFRQLHTIKGTSNTFDLNILAHFAHEIENLLQAIRSNEISQTDETTFVIQTCIENLLSVSQNYLDERQVSVPTELTDRIRTNLAGTRVNFEEDLLISCVPQSIISQLSEREKSNLSAALQKGRIFYLIEAAFRHHEFALEFKRLRDQLNENGEVIAVSSGTADDPIREICIQFLFVTDLRRKSLEQATRSDRIKFVFETSPKSLNNGDNLTGMIANLIAESEKIARVLGKNVVFETSLEIAELPNEFLILLNQTISHLLHNAIDHAIETADERIEKGKDPVARIEINVSAAASNLVIQIKDDGRGIAFDKVIEIARRKGLVDSEKILTKEETQELIFFPGFSTSDAVSEISGRGVGLDAVQEMVRRSGGQIGFKTATNQGTTFTIHLPFL